MGDVRIPDQAEYLARLRRAARPSLLRIIRDLEALQASYCEAAGQVVPSLEQNGRIMAAHEAGCLHAAASLLPCPLH